MKRFHWAVIILASAILVLFLTSRLNRPAKTNAAQPPGGSWSLTFAYTNTAVSNWQTLPQRDTPSTNKASF